MVRVWRFGFKAVLLGALVCVAWATASSGPGSSLDGHQAGEKATVADWRGLAAELKPVFKEWQAVDWRAIPEAERPAKNRGFEQRVDVTLTQYVEMRLDAAPRLTAAVVEEELNRALIMAIREGVRGHSHEEVSAALSTGGPAKFAFILQGEGSASDLYFAAFPLGFGHTYSVSVHGFARVDGRYVSVATTPAAELENSIPKAIRVRAFGGRELRVLAWGLHIGTPGLTSLVVYSFDGQQLRVLWRKDRVRSAQASISGGRVEILGFKPKEPGEWTSSVHMRQIYEQVPSGLELLKTEYSEKPFPGQKY